MKLNCFWDTSRTVSNCCRFGWNRQLNCLLLGVRYQSGGVASGFNEVTTNAEGEKRLFQVKGKRNVRVRQVPFSLSSMNKGDCFILDAGRDIHVYVGTESKRVEKLKAISAANQIRDQDHNGRATVHILDEFSSFADQQEFFTVLGEGSPEDVPDASAGEDDGAFEKNDTATITLYKVSDDGGSLRVEPISTRPLTQAMLATEVDYKPLYTSHKLSNVDI